MTREETVKEVVNRIVDYFRPERVYLIGSTARGDYRPDSDLDFVVVLPEDAPRDLAFETGIYGKLWGIPLAVDIMPFHRNAFEQRSEWLMSLPAVALREGRLEYEATGFRR